jgi:UDP-N-acetylmuramoylalanine--D-glutamate ligase
MQYELVILGSGESGVGAALLAKARGISVFVSDGGKLKNKYKEELVANAIPFEEEKHTEEIILAAAEVIKSPGISPKTEIVKKIAAKNISIISEIEFGYRHMGTGRIVAITGSNGKTTTTNLTHYIFQHAGYSVAMCGNVGYSFARQIAVEPKDWYIIEVSSFQLDDIKTFKPNVAVLLNITPDHLDRYNYNFSEYIASKFRIAMNQTAEDIFVICADDKGIADGMTNLTSNPNIIRFTMNEKKDESFGAYTNDNNLMIDINGELVSMPLEDLSLNGKHNLHNSMASGVSARVAEIRKENIREALSTFKGLEHRLETVATIRGIQFINDSKATNVNSVWFALESAKKPTVLILGGVDKGNDYSEIFELVQEKVKAIICLGVNNEPIHTAFASLKLPIVNVSSAKDAVNIAYELAENGDAVLLSPACASFDLFNNFEDRGAQFKKAVLEL